MSRYEDFSVNKLRLTELVGNPTDTTAIAVGTALTQGASGTGYDYTWYSGTAGDYMMWDASDKQLEFIDCNIEMGNADVLAMGFLADGSTDAIAMQFTGTLFQIMPGSTTEALNVGSTTYHVNISLGGAFTVGATAAGHGEDFTVYASDSAAYILVDASANKAIFDKVDLQIGDSDELRFGDLAAGDWVIKFDGADLSILPASALEAMLVGDSSHVANVTLKGLLTVGVDDTGYDVKLFGATTGAFALWDESDDSIIMTKAQLEFDSYKTAGAFDFANDNSVVLTNTHSASVIANVKVLFGATTGYLKVFMS